MKMFKVCIYLYMLLSMVHGADVEWGEEPYSYGSSVGYAETAEEALAQEEAVRQAIMKAERDASFPSAFTEKDKEKFDWLVQDSLTRLQDALNANPDPGAYVSIVSRAIHNYLLEGLDQYLPGDTSNEFDTFENDTTNGVRALFKKMEFNNVEDVEDLENTVERLQSIVVRRFPNAQPFFTEAISMLSLKPGGLSSGAGVIPKITLGTGY